MGGLQHWVLGWPLRREWAHYFYTHILKRPELPLEEDGVTVDTSAIMMTAANAIGGMIQSPGWRAETCWVDGDPTPVCLIWEMDVKSWRDLPKRVPVERSAMSLEKMKLVSKLLGGIRSPEGFPTCDSVPAEYDSGSKNDDGTLDDDELEELARKTAAERERSKVEEAKPATASAPGQSQCDSSENADSQGHVGGS